MRKRIVSLLLAAVMLLGLSSVAAAAQPEGEAAGSFVFAAASPTSMAVEPERISYTQGQTIRQALASSSHTFDGIETGYIRAIDGVSGTFMIYDDVGEYDLDRPAASIQSIAFLGVELSTAQARTLSAMLLAMADYNLSENGVQNYPEAQSAYEAARRALFRTDLDYDALAEALRAAMQKYDDEVLHGTKIPLQLTFGTLEGAALNGWRFSVTDAYGAQSEFTSFPIALLPGDYAFTLTASDGANSARGSMCVASDGTVTAGGEALTEICVSGGQWLTAPILRSGSSLEAGVYTVAQTGSFEASYLVPDNRSGSVYFYVKPGSGLSAGSAYSTDTVQLYVCYERNGSRTENLKPWLSVNAVAAQLLQAGSAAVSATAEARYAMPGYTVVQSFAMLLERTPTLRALDVRCGGVAQSIGFDPDVNAYTCSVTADSVELTAQPFSEAAALRINGTAVAAGESFRLAVPSSGARAEITLSLSGKTQTYVVDFTSVASCPVTIRHAAGTQIAVYNAAGAQIGPSEETATSATFPLIPNERCTYVATINEFFHTSEAFTAASGLTLTAQEPETDSWLTSTQIRSGGNASRSDAFFAAKDFQSSTHEYGVRVIDTQSNLYLWGKEDGYSITEPESGTEIAAGLKENGVNLAGFLTPGSEGRTLTLRVTKNADPRFYQDYLFHISRALTLRDRDGIQAKLDGTDAALFQLENGKLTGAQGFDNEVLDYQLQCVRGAKKLLLQATPYQSDYQLRIGGETVSQTETGAASAELTLDSAQDTETFEIVLSSASDPDAGQTYRVRVVKSEAIATTFTLTGSDGSTLNSGLVALYDVVSGIRMWPDADGAFHLVGGSTYRYTATCAGYIGTQGTMVASAEAAAQNVRLEKAPAARSVAVTSTWPSFRGGDDSNGVVTAKTPVTTDTAILSWANKLGNGFSGEALGCPILITENGYDYLIVYQTNQLLKVDALSGTVVARAQMDHGSDFAINSATFAEGMLFVGLSNGSVQAFYADTLQSAWLYTDPLGGQPNCPITYHDGYIYTGFWVSETAYTNYVCLSVTDEDPTQTCEEKLASWTYSSKGGFYWAGAYVTDAYLLVGTDDGDTGCTSSSSALLCLDPKTGAELDWIGGLCGDIRCSVAKYGDRFFFTSKGGYFYSISMTTAADGSARIDHDSLKTVALSNGTDTAQSPAMSTCTPVIYGGRAYVGVSGASQFGAYSGHNITVIDLSAWKIAYSVPTQGYPQTSGLLTTAYAADGSVYVYFFDNYTPGKLRVLKDAPGQTAPELVTTERYNDRGTMLSVDTPYVLFTPQDEQAQYAICSPITDSYGTIYFKNDSAYLMSLTNAVTNAEIVIGPERTVYTTDDEFDPAGMTVKLTYSNGLTRTIPVRRTVGETTIDYFSWGELSTDTAEDFLLTYKGALYHNGPDGEKVNLTGAQVAVSLTVTQGTGEKDSCVKLLEGAPETAETVAGKDYTLTLSEVFIDSEGHALSYSLDTHGYGSRVFLRDDTLHFSVPNAGSYTLTLRAQCEAGGKAKLTLRIEVTAAQDGGKSQYSYDETDAEQVTVYVTISNDGVPLLGTDAAKTPLARREITVPYFDLGLYGLDEYARYKTTDGQGPYTSSTLVERPTALHLYIYLLERYYLGLPEEQCCKGTSGLLSYKSAREVTDLFGNRANAEKNFSGVYNALTLSGSATSLYMRNFWGHDENLMYFRNHVYPLMSAGWGATCDYMLLSDGDTIDLAMFTDWNFHHVGAFCKFDKDEYSVPAEEGLKLQTLKYDTRSVTDGGTESFVKIGTLNLAVYNEDWTSASAKAKLTGSDGAYTVTFTEPGTYYLLATDPNAATDSACYAPATARVTVTEKRAYILGDVNGDGAIDTRDITRLRRYFAGVVELSETQLKAADVNQDGRVDTRDITRLRRYFAGLAELGS